MNKRYCTIKELSGYTGIPVSTLYEWANLNVIPSIKIRKRVIFDLDDIQAAFEKLKRKDKVQNSKDTIKKNATKILDSLDKCDTFSISREQAPKSSHRKEGANV
jgi:excisionase family DNA binding protein|tara:strand:- start:1113 stop:1424 length:312 start_codon:yes stop_codon:yes gene_type:complete